MTIPPNSRSRDKGSPSATSRRRIRPASVFGPAHQFVIAYQTSFQSRFKRGRTLPVDPIPQLLEMDLKPRTLLGGVILGSTQGDHCIKRILSSRCASLTTICASMVDQQDRNALSAQF